jgi:hypothetical protein
MRYLRIAWLRKRMKNEQFLYDLQSDAYDLGMNPDAKTLRWRWIRYVDATFAYLRATEKETAQ